MILIKEKGMMYRRLFFLSLLCIFPGILSGCAAVTLGSAGATGYKTATDERSIGTMIDDSVIASTVKTRMISDDFVKARYIDVDVLNGVVYLIGVVESSSQKRMAGDIARGVDGVRQVHNQLSIGETSPGTILDDSVLTSKIKAELIKAKGVHSNNVDVDTVNGVVSLTGILSSHKEKNDVLYIVHKTAGNRRIIDNLSVGN